MYFSAIWPEFCISAHLARFVLNLWVLNILGLVLWQNLAEPEPGYTSRTLMKWLSNPVPSRVLGLAMLVELRYAGFLVLIDFEISKEILALVAYPEK